MITKKHSFFYFFYIFSIFFLGTNSFAQSVKITNDVNKKRLIFSNEKLKFVLDYNKKANISTLVVNGQQVIDGNEGIYSKFIINKATYSSLNLKTNPTVKITKNIVSVSGIKYGEKNFSILENWIFTIGKEQVQFDMDRTLSNAIVAEKVCLPVFTFNNINTWEGAYQDYGGVAWFYLFNRKLDTYGVYSNSSDFWNSKTNNGLNITVSSPGKYAAMDYSRTATDKLTFTIAVAAAEVLPRFDADTQRRMYVRDTTDVWAPIKIDAGKTSQSITLSYFDFKQKYGRGNLKGINEDQVSTVLNTIARIGVIGKKHIGGNSWHTPYGPICLHEQYIAEIGLGINDDNYLKGYQETLDFYRDNAIKPDGRVWSRWAYSNEDAMQKNFNDKGFYEAQWGYLMDSNPDFVTNVSELYDQTGDLNWVKKHQLSCEKVLDWILKRDSNNNGLVEMMTDSHNEKRGSDWLDIIWASYENAFVNAKLYKALVLWINIEKQLGNTAKESEYKTFAEKLKMSFNKTTAEGGFWDADKKCYIHWRDKDGSIHGNNMVTPVNFMAIAYGLCDNTERKAEILDGIEMQMQKENLFFWPVCMYSYAPGEGNDWQFPFPAYENGDIFLSWGSVAVKAYSSYKPEVALKYVKNVLAQYAKDGLAFQRYGRTTQAGLGDDILSGNCLSVVGLYQSIYGVNPLYNRFYLDPHITTELSGTKLRYNYRNQKLNIDLEADKYSVSNGHYKVSSKTDFGFFSTQTELLFFKGKAEKSALKVHTQPKVHLSLDIKKWNENEISFNEYSTSKTVAKLAYQINDLKGESFYTILINNQPFKRLKTSKSGVLVFDRETSDGVKEVLVLNK